MWYPSSKRCSQCHQKKTDLKLNERIFNCSFGCQPICRDLNSAINLANAPEDEITTRVGSTRRHACGLSSADTLVNWIHPKKQEINTLVSNFG